MIPSLVTHVRQGLQTQLDTLLGSKDSSYIINALLKDYDEATVKSFLNRYVVSYDGDGKAEEHDREPIRVISAFPETEASDPTLIFIAPGEGKQSVTSIGGNEGGSIQRSKERLTETVALHVTPLGTSLTTTKPIGNNFNIPDLALDPSFYTIKDNIVTFNISEKTANALNLKEGTELKVVYDTPEGKKFGSVERGYTAREEVQIHIMSNNQNTILLLDGLIKVALIMMTNNVTQAEGQIYNNPLVSYQPLMPVDENSIPSLPHIKFIRELDISYDVSYSFAFGNLQELSRILWNEDLIEHN